MDSDKTPYDSAEETHKHIAEVRSRLRIVIDELESRSEHHDETKLGPVEKPLFDVLTPKLKDCTYGSDEYKGYLAELKPALDHHYATYSHHPEHFGEDGISGMSLVDVVEMLCDWDAACKRHADGDVRKSIEINQKRFGYSDELKQLLLNTLTLLGYS